MTTKSTVMATRKTFDGATVQFWNDGDVTCGMGFVVRGCGQARSSVAQDKNIEAAWLLAGEVSLYDKAELPAAVKAARKAVREVGVDGAMTPLLAFREMMGKRALTQRGDTRPLGAASLTALAIVTVLSLSFGGAACSFEYDALNGTGLVGDGGGSGGGGGGSGGVGGVGGGGGGKDAGDDRVGGSGGASGDGGTGGIGGTGGGGADGSAGTGGSDGSSPDAGGWEAPPYDGGTMWRENAEMSCDPSVDRRGIACPEGMECAARMGSHQGDKTVESKCVARWFGAMTFTGCKDTTGLPGDCDPGLACHPDGPGYTIGVCFTLCRCADGAAGGGCPAGQKCYFATSTKWLACSPGGVGYGNGIGVCTPG